MLSGSRMFRARRCSALDSGIRRDEEESRSIRRRKEAVLTVLMGRFTPRLRPHNDLTGPERTILTCLASSSAPLELKFLHSQQVLRTIKSSEGASEARKRSRPIRIIRL